MKMGAAVMVGDANKSVAIGHSPICNWSRLHCLHSGKSIKSSLDPAPEMRTWSWEVSGGSIGLVVTEFIVMFVSGITVFALGESGWAVPKVGSLDFPEPAPNGL